MDQDVIAKTPAIVPQSLNRRALLRATLGMAMASAASSPTAAYGTACDTVLPPTAPPNAPASDFLRMLAFVPAPLDRWQRTISYAAPGLIKERYGLGDVRSYRDLQARGLSTGRFASYFGGCWSSPFAYNGLSTDRSERDAFGFDFYQVARDLSAGEPPMFLNTEPGRNRPPAFGRIEGVFDAVACIAVLQGGGYAVAAYGEDAYFTTLGDGETDLKNIRSRLFPERRNRLATDAGRVIAAAATIMMEAALDAERGRVLALDSDPTMRALAFALGDATSIVTLPPDYADRSIAAARARSRSSVGTAQVIARGLRERTASWGTLHPPELLAVAVTDAGEYARTLHLACVYMNPDDAAADAPEIASRLTGYRVAPGNGSALPAGENFFTLRTETHAGWGIVVADASFLVMSDLNPAWVQGTVTSLLPYVALQNPGETIRRLEAEIATPSSSSAPAP